MRYSSFVALIWFYAASRSAAECSTMETTLGTLGDVVSMLTQKNAELAKLLPTCTFLLNSENCDDLTQKLEVEDRIDVLPQFSGG